MLEVPLREAQGNRKVLRASSFFENEANQHGSLLVGPHHGDLHIRLDDFFAQVRGSSPSRCGPRKVLTASPF